MMRELLLIASIALSCTAAPGNHEWGSPGHAQAWQHGEPHPRPFDGAPPGPWAPWHHGWTRIWGTSTLQSASTTTSIGSGSASYSSSQRSAFSTTTTTTRTISTEVTTTRTISDESTSTPVRSSASLPLSPSMPVSSVKISTTFQVSSVSSTLSTSISTAPTMLSSSVLTPSLTTQPGTCASIITVTELSTVTPPSETSTTEIVSGTNILVGDDLGPPLTRATSYTKTFLDQDTVFAAGTTTVTYTYGPNITVSKHATVTIQTPAGFSPVQDTLPSVRFFPNNYPNDSNPIVKKRAVNDAASDQACTTTVTSITVLPTPVVISTATLTGTIYVYPIETTQFGGDYNPTSLPPASSTTISRTVTSYDETITVSTTVQTLVTVTASTTTVYAACATDNFANYYSTANESLEFEATSLSGALKSGFVATSYDCCAQAFEAKATRFAVQDVSGGGLQCYIFVNATQITCPVDQGFAVLAYESDTREIAIGNGPCGRWNVLLD